MDPHLAACLSFLSLHKSCQPPVQQLSSLSVTMPGFKASFSPSLWSFMTHHWKFSEKYSGSVIINQCQHYLREGTSYKWKLVDLVCVRFSGGGSKEYVIIEESPKVF